MNRCIRWIVAALLAMLFAPSTSVAQDAARSAQKPLQILFIGNSLTYYNAMPRLFAAYVAGAYPGTRVEVDMLAPDGESLAQHWARGTAQARIGAQHWDYVVLQEQGGLAAAIRIDGVVHIGSPERFTTAARQFVAAIRAAGAKPVFYETYASKGMEEQFRSIDYATMKAAREAQAPIAPVGRAWQLPLGKRAINLYAADNAHPSLHGSFLVAATLAHTLFGPPAVGAAVVAPPQIAKDDAIALVAAAASSVAELKANGGYADVAQPALTPVPAVTRDKALTDAALTGTWNARASGLRLSLGSQWHLRFDDGRPVLRVVDFGVNAQMDLPVQDLRIVDDVLHFRTHANNTAYEIAASLAHDGLHVLVTTPKANSTEYRHALFRRDGESTYFQALTQRFAALDAAIAKHDFDAALLAHYRALPDTVGDDALARVLGQGLLDNEWLAIMTAADYIEQKNCERGLRFYRFATTHFPKSAAAHQNLAEGLEHCDRLQDALVEVERSQSLTAAGDAAMLNVLREQRQRLQMAIDGAKPQP